MMSLENKQHPLGNLKPLWIFDFFFRMACERIFIKTHSIESRRVIGPERTVCRRVRASFSPVIIQAGAVMGLMLACCACL